MKAALNFLHSFTNPSPDEERGIDLGTFVDEEEDDIDDESDLASEHNGDLESDLLSDTEDKTDSAEEIQWSPTLQEQVLRLRILIYLYYSSPPVEIFKLFITDDFVTKMAEHTQLLCCSKRHTTIIQASI